MTNDQAVFWLVMGAAIWYFGSRIAAAARSWLSYRRMLRHVQRFHQAHEKGTKP